MSDEIGEKYFKTKTIFSDTMEVLDDEIEHFLYGSNSGECDKKLVDIKFQVIGHPHLDPNVGFYAMIIYT